jgi:hypothetical protein
MSTTLTNHAVVVTKPGEAAVQEVSVPKLRDDYILVKVKAVALNPTDWKHVDFLTTKGARVSSLSMGQVGLASIAIHASQLLRVNDRETASSALLFYSKQKANVRTLSRSAVITPALLKKWEAKSPSHSRRATEYAVSCTAETKSSMRTVLSRTTSWQRETSR